MPELSYEELLAAIAPKSDQLNADDLVAGPITVSILDVRKSDATYQIDLEGYPRRPWKPCKTVLRTLAHVWSEEAGEEEAETIDIDEKKIRSVIQIALDEERTQLLGTEAKEIMLAAGMDVPPFKVARTIDEAVKAAEEVGYPVVMKVVSEDIVHKTDMGGVLLDIDDEKEVVEGYEAIIRNCKRCAPKANIRGMEIAKMVQKGVEIIIGSTTDPSFGKVLMFGLGGIYVEVLKDVAFRVAPVTKREIEKMIREISSYPLLIGVRGESRKDINSVIDAIYRVGILVDRFPEISELDINPLVVYEKGAKVLDARMNIEVKK